MGVTLRILDCWLEREVNIIAGFSDAIIRLLTFLLVLCTFFAIVILKL